MQKSKNVVGGCQGVAMGSQWVNDKEKVIPFVTVLVSYGFEKLLHHFQQNFKRNDPKISCGVTIITLS